MNIINVTMENTKTIGYTEIVKIAEAALNGDKDKARAYIAIFIAKFPESDLEYPFTNLLEGKTNPSNLGHGKI